MKFVAISSVFDEPAANYEPAIALGGLHTCPGFAKIQLGDKYALGHICPKYALDNIDEAMLSQALDSTMPKAFNIILDWKGLGQHKKKVMAAIEELKKSREVNVIKSSSL